MVAQPGKIFVARPLYLGVAVLLGLAARPVTAGAGILACVACFTEFCGAISAMCASTIAASPLAVATCITLFCSPCGPACAVVGFTCFDEDTMITTHDGQKHIAEVKKKDLVLGIDNRYSAVTENVFVEGPVEMVRLQFVEHEAHLTATSSHWHYVLGDSGSLVPIQASEITVGMTMLHHSKTNLTVAAVSTLHTSGRWSLSTESCSALANGFLSGTICTSPGASLFVHQLAKLNASARAVSDALHA